VYRPTGDPRLTPNAADASTRAGWRGVGANVWFLGLTSLVTDVSSEMITSILPAYSLLVLGLSPAAFGVLDGLQQGGASLARIASGLVTDRFGKYKQIAAGGYVASALSRLGLLAAGSNPLLLSGAVLADRIGKGVRTSPRDALISLSVPPFAVGRAFGVHRALDTAGATLGPIAAFVLLRVTRNDYPSVIVTSFAVALVAVAILMTYVRNPASSGTATSLRPLLEGGAVGSLLSRGGVRTLVSCALLLGAVTLADSMIYLMLQRRIGFDYQYIPLFYVATPAVYAALAVPFGRAADTAGRGTILLCGYAALAVLYVMLMLPSAGWVTLGACVVLLGAYYAMTDGVLPALASGLVGPSNRATAIALAGTALDVGRLIASMAFGLIWSLTSPRSAIGAFVVALLVALTLVSGRVMRLEGRAG
jgi:MFS family permease